MDTIHTMEASKRLAHLIGQPFGRWLVREIYKKEPGASSAMALCECQCEAKTRRLMEVHGLNRGNTKSCGCVTVERMKAQKIRKTHGEGDWRNGKRTPEYMIWLDMKWRCSPKNKSARKLYFKRGIRVCERWMKYENFLEDMGRKPTPKHEIDRRDNDLGYFKDNCRWATEREQSLNRRDAHFVYLDGEIVPLSVAAEKLGLPYLWIYRRTEPIEFDSEADKIATLGNMKHPPTLHLD